MNKMNKLSLQAKNLMRKYMLYICTCKFYIQNNIKYKIIFYCNIKIEI